jgi:hypothetical protein
LSLIFKYEGLGMGTLALGSPSGIARGGTGVLKVDGTTVATHTMEHTIPFMLQWDENFDVGAETGAPVDDQDYQVPFGFNGKLDKLTLTINWPQLTPADIEKSEGSSTQQQDQRITNSNRYCEGDPNLWPVRGG